MNRYMAWLIFGWCLCTMMACDPIESGEPPTFSGSARAKVLGSSQVSITWNPGSDDIVDPDELRYGIWFAKSGETIDSSMTPDVLTQAGAIAFNLTGLDAESTYEVLVRARDLGLQFSENTQTTNFTTPAEGAGRIRDPQIIELNYQTDGLLRGFISSQPRYDLGLIDGTRIRWHASGPSGIAETETEVTNVGSEILEAYMVPTVDLFRDDLFVVTASGLSFYRNQNGRFTDVTWTASQSIAPNSVRFHLVDGVLDAISFVETGSQGHIYSNDAEEQESDDTFFYRGITTLPNGGTEFFLDNLDGDEFVDLVSFGPQGLHFAAGADEDYTFDSADPIDSDFVQVADDHTLLVADGDRDGDRDVYIFDRNVSRNRSELNIWENNGDGTFQTATTTDFEGAIYTDPEFIDATGDLGQDLIFQHKPGNNIAVFQGPSGAFNQVSDYFGTDLEVRDWMWGAFDNEVGPDLVLVTGTQLILLRTVPPTTTQPFKAGQALAKP